MMLVNDPHDPRGDRATRATRAHHAAATITGIPRTELPDGAARGCLLEMASAGCDVAAFRAADGRWVIRLWDRTETCAEWSAHFHI